MSTMQNPAPRALIFDVFGTLVDWHGSIAREAAALLGPRVPDPAQFAVDWRAQYQPAMEQVRSGELPFCKLDVLHRHNLDRVLADRGLHDVDDTTRTQLTRAWHRLDAWPEVPAALARLRERFLIAPCSNGNISLMVALARRNRLPWDAILGAELARDYKPQPAVYLNACEALDCAPPMWRGPTSMAPASASARPRSPSTARRRTWPTWPRSWAAEVARRPRMTEYILHGNPGWGSALVEAQLDGYGLPWRYQASGDLFASAEARERLRVLNPLSQVPVLELPDGTVMTESAAITLHLADRSGRDDFVPGPQAPERAAFLRWLVYLVANVYPTFTYADEPTRFVKDEAAARAFRAEVDAYAQRLWLAMEGAAGAPWFLGERCSAIDIYLAVMTRWRPRRDWFAQHAPRLHAAALRAEALPALSAMLARNFASAA